MRTRVRSLTKRGSSEGVKDVGREQGAKQFENIITDSVGAEVNKAGTGIIEGSSRETMDSGEGGHT